MDEYIHINTYTYVALGVATATLNDMYIIKRRCNGCYMSLFKTFLFEKSFESCK